jgi:subtilase family serine protease
MLYTHKNDEAQLLMSFRNAPDARRFFPSASWHTILLLTAVLVFSSCAFGNSTQNNAKTPTPATPASTPGTDSPYKPGPLAAQAISDCNTSAAVGGCFSPEQVQTFYDLNPLYEKGFDGKGTTIVILDSFGSPTIKHDLQMFDQTFGLPDPPSFQVLYPLGQVTVDPSNSDQVGWEGETTLDVEWAHAIAPGANIVLLVSTVSETEGVQGFPEFEKLSTYAMDHQLGQVFSMSFGATEPTLIGDACKENLGTGESLLKSYDQTVFQRAVTEHITMLSSSGDDGATDATCNPPATYTFQAVGWPASDPLVTAVGGTKLAPKDSAGDFGSERAWNEFGGASGGGLSQLYAEPDWQKSLPNQSMLKGRRGLPDVSWGAAVNFAFYHTYPGDGGGWSAIGGTSASSPQWAGLVAIADQMAGKPLGFLNPALYHLAGKGFHDITTGDNSLEGVQGFQAGPGWDLVTGWGTPDAAVLVPLLITAVQQTAG